MGSGRYGIQWGILATGLAGCTLALDFDSLQAGRHEDTDGEGTCITVDDCDDNIDCTEDLCDENNRCVHNPDNSRCDALEMCRRDEGCVETGRECVSDGQCDDGVACTINRCSDGECKYMADDDWCEDNDPCWMGSECDETLGCTGGYAMQCDQPAGASCYLVVCNPETGLCDDQQLKNGADSDEDGFCDDNPLFGGDDCNDGDPDINPGLDDVCNSVDDNCDGLTDAHSLDGPAEIPVGGDAAAPAVAFDGSRFAVVWQEGSGDGATVRLQVLGTGECVAKTECAAADSTAATAPVDLTTLAGDAADMPAIAGNGGRFSAVWRATAEGEPPAIVQLGFEIDPETHEIVLDDPVVLTDDTAEDLLEPEIDWQGSEGWTAAWIARTGGADTVQAMIEGGVPLTGEAAAGPIRELTLTCFDGTDCLAAYVVEDGDDEIYEARFAASGAVLDYREGWPRLISIASEERGDPSTNPRIAWVSEDSWVVSFTDIAIVDPEVGPEPESDIRAAADGEVQAVIAEADADQINIGLAYDGDRFALMYLLDLEGDLSLDLRYLDDGLAPFDRQLTRLGQLRTGEFIVSPIRYTGEGFALVWGVASRSATTLQFAHFTGCVASDR